MVAGKTGTREEQDRRRGFLTKKWISIVIDLIAVLGGTFLLPVSVLLTNSTFNSYKMAIHVLANAGTFVPTATVTVIRLLSAFERSRKELTRTRATKLRSDLNCALSSLPGGMSALEQSEV